MLRPPKLAVVMVYNIIYLFLLLSCISQVMFDLSCYTKGHSFLHSSPGIIQEISFQEI